ncbi:hypothetical protein NPX13_g6188 [Xylaria arbuscula]|uniref:Uncharacterized protein n=1 Tax=Xylaria arbuscula TaxID=114810 RepID=A0A9W8ND08_9PEZI|nr:hypothetical protein NPX13_g6188 [Xylaria arbuscula]
MENTGTARPVRSEPPPTPPGFISDPSAENGVGCRVYSLRWTDNGIVQITINSATQLQAYIQEDGSSARQLLVFQGLSQEYEAVLKETTGIETSFLDAHIRRRSYRPPRTTRTSTAAHCWAHYDYPELDLDRGLDDRRCSRTVDDRVSEPPTYRIPTTGGSIMLCRASMWLSEKAHILFLDRAPGVSPARLNAHIGKVETDAHGIPFTWNEMDINGHTIPRGNEILSLETLLYETLRESCSDPEDQDLPDLLEDLVVDKWADLFAALSPDLPVRTIEVASFFSQASIGLFWTKDLTAGPRNGKRSSRGSPGRHSS